MNKFNFLKDKTITDLSDYGVREAIRILSNGKKNSSAQISNVLDKSNRTYLGRHWFRKK